MHELAITQEIIRIIKEESIKNKIKPSTVKIELGSFTSYKKDALIYYYDILKKDSALISNSALLVDEAESSYLKIKEITGD